MRRRLSALVLGLALALSIAPAGAAPVPVVASSNVELLASIPDISAISTAFDPTRPLMYVNTLDGVSVYDISIPSVPVPQGRVAMPHFENEAMAVGQRTEPDGSVTTFVLVGLDVFASTPTDPANALVESGQHVIVIDVTDPLLPVVRGRTDTSSSTHTIQCVSTDCGTAYTSGAYQDEGVFHAIDLSDLDAPKEIAQLHNVVGCESGGYGAHQWDLDEKGYLWASSGCGTAAYDVSDPLNPIPLASTNEKGTESPYNDFIMHNSFRPNADEMGADEEPQGTGKGRGKKGGHAKPQVPPSAETASPDDGNVLLVTEEDYLDPSCKAEGTFSTWYIPYVDATQYAADNPEMLPTGGSIEPLDNWNSEILDSGQKTVAGALCSAHYFTYHEEAGIVAQGWYQQGTRLLDVRDPRDIKQIGYFFTGDTETWHAYWVPERNEHGAVTGKDTNIIYTNDVARGIDVLQVNLPDTAPEDTVPVRAPILPQWLSGVGLVSSAPSDKFGYLCRLAALGLVGGVRALRDTEQRPQPVLAHHGLLLRVVSLTS